MSDQSKKEKGIHALNKDFRKYEQVRKDHEYNLVEHAETESFDEEYEIRTCDMRLFFEGGDSGRQQFAKELGEALEGIGFAILSNTGVDPLIYQNGETKVADLFENTKLFSRFLKYFFSSFSTTFFWHHFST